MLGSIILLMGFVLVEITGEVAFGIILIELLEA